MTYQRPPRDGFTGSALGETKREFGVAAAAGEHLSAEPGKPPCVAHAWAGGLGLQLKQALFMLAKALKWLVLGHVFPQPCPAVTGLA